MTPEDIKLVKSLWKMFPNNIIYSTSSSKGLITKEEENIYIYSIHRVNNIKIRKINIGSTFFEVYQVKADPFSVKNSIPVGYIFVPLRNHKKLRYTSVTLSASNDTATKEAVLCCERKTLLSDNIYLIWLSCGAEIVTILPTILGVYPS